MAIFEELKSIGKTLQEAGKIELYQQISDIQEKLLDMQKRISDLEDENKVLKEKLQTRETLIFDKNAYWIDKDGKKEGPLCSCCWDDNQKTIRMQPCGNPAFYECPKCKNRVQVYDDKMNYSQGPEDFDRFSVF